MPSNENIQRTGTLFDARSVSFSRFCIVFFFEKFFFFASEFERVNGAKADRDNRNEKRKTKKFTKSKMAR